MTLRHHVAPVLILCGFATVTLVQTQGVVRAQERAQQAQDMIPLQVTPAQADYLERLLRKQVIEEGGVLYFSLNNQIIQYNQTRSQTQVNNFEKQVRERIAADAARAAEKAAAERPPAPAEEVKP